MKHSALSLALLLLTACGPSPEAVECCECLRGTMPRPVEIVQGDDGWSTDMLDIPRDVCPLALEEGRLWADESFWTPGEPDEFQPMRGVCAEACAAKVDELALALERL